LLAASPLLAACVLATPGDFAVDAGPQRDAAPTTEERHDAAQPRPRAERTPWIEAGDPVGQRYPAYGVALYHMSYIYETPSKSARVVGYMRRGARFRASEEVSRKECSRGWFEVPGGGFVCHGDGFLVDSTPPASDDAAPTPAALSDALPYPYSKVLAADVPQYMRIPTPAEEQAVLAAFAGHPMPAVDAADPSAEPQAAPELSTDVSALLRLRMQPGFYISVDRIEAEGAREWVRSVRGGYVHAEQLVDAKLPEGMGVALGRRYTLPLAFVYRGGAPALRLDPVTGEAVKVGFDLPLHSAHVLTGEKVVRSGRRYFVTEEGLLLRDTAVRVVDRVDRPKIVPRQERWIRVDLDRQTLTAYEGEEPVFATLVSSGLPDHATPQGIFRLHAKHVTATMADDLASDGPYSIEDVPWTMYFSGSYALHAAFWHERFGHPRSHGCVNLAPRDARWLFFWTAPALPSAWHGILAGVGKGTTVVLDTGVPYSLEQP
jgi:lipoprotein-anchoring transpeptidase ErfK/SrfK